MPGPGPRARAARRGGRPQRCARPGPRRERPSRGRDPAQQHAQPAHRPRPRRRGTASSDRTGDGSSEQHRHREHDLHDLAGGALPGDRPQAQPDVADVAAVAHAAVHVAEHPAGQRGVEELRAVVRGDRGPQRHPDAEAAGDQPPSPGAAHRGQQRDARRPPRGTTRRPCGRRRGTGRCPAARPGRPGSRRRPAGAPTPSHVRVIRGLRSRRVSGRRTCVRAAAVHRACQVARRHGATPPAPARPGRSSRPVRQGRAPLAGRVPQPLPQVGVVEPAAQRRGQGRSVAGRHQQAGPAPAGAIGRAPPAPRRRPSRPPAARGPAPR